MGSGASIGTTSSKAKVSGGSSDNGDNFFVPLSLLHGHLKVYQHCTTGEVMVLVDNVITDIGNIVDKPTEWYVVSVCNKQAQYLESLKVHTSLKNKNLSRSEKISELPWKNVETPIVLIPQSRRY
jgi:tellurite resistance-related uncharacterized protein